MNTWALDIECADWTRFIFGAAVTGGGTVERFRTAGAMLDWYLDLPQDDILLAHNGGRYDFLAFLDADAGAHDWTGTLAGASIISLRAKGHAELRDSYRLFPLALGAWTGQKEALALPCICGDDCGGYCSIRENMPKAQRRLLEEYCIQDCRALLAAWNRDVPALEALGYDMRSTRGLRRTIGGVAWATAARMAGLQDAESLSWIEYLFHRRAYYGGRCEVFRTRARSGYRYDINSAYPWALTLPVPVGPATVARGPDALRALARERPGIYSAKVFVPDGLPLLPIRGRTRLLWATGTVSGIWATPELVTAVAHGARVDTIERALVWADEAPIFADYMQFVWRHRAAATAADDSAMRQWHKLAGNSLSGKLAQSPGAESLYVGKSPPDGAAWIGGDAWSIERSRIPPCARPAWAAFLTARVRATLLDRLARGTPIYCDTDSAYTVDADRRNVGGALGQWKLEGRLYDWRALAPKLYTYEDEDGESHVRARGIPRATRATLDALERGETVRNRRGVCGVREAISGHGRAFVRRDLSRSWRAGPRLAGARRTRVTGETYPPRIEASGRISWPGTPATTRELLALAREIALTPRAR